MSKIVHFEIPVDDPDRASAFYHDVLGWEISGFGKEPYWTCALVRTTSPARTEPSSVAVSCIRVRS